MNKELGKRIAELRTKKNLTQAELARELHFTYQAVSNWERGVSMPDVETIIKISEFFHVSSDELLKGEDTHDTTDKEGTSEINKNGSGTIIAASETSAVPITQSANGNGAYFGDETYQDGINENYRNGESEIFDYGTAKHSSPTGKFEKFFLIFAAFYFLFAEVLFYFLKYALPTSPTLNANIMKEIYRLFSYTLPLFFDCIALAGLALLIYAKQPKKGVTLHAVFLVFFVNFLLFSIVSKFAGEKYAPVSETICGIVSFALLILLFAAYEKTKKDGKKIRMAEIVYFIALATYVFLTIFSALKTQNASYRMNAPLQLAANAAMLLLLFAAAAALKEKSCAIECSNQRLVASQGQTCQTSPAVPKILMPLLFAAVLFGLFLLIFVLQILSEERFGNTEITPQRAAAFILFFALLQAVFAFFFFAGKQGSKLSKADLVACAVFIVIPLFSAPLLFWNYTTSSMLREKAPSWAYLVLWIVYLAIFFYLSFAFENKKGKRRANIILAFCYAVLTISACIVVFLSEKSIFNHLTLLAFVILHHAFMLALYFVKTDRLKIRKIA